MQLLFTPFFSAAMQGTDSHIPGQEYINIMVKRIKEIKAPLQTEVLLYLAAELENTVRKLPSIPRDLRDDFKLKIEAIKKVLEEF